MLEALLTWLINIVEIQNEQAPFDTPIDVILKSFYVSRGNPRVQYLYLCWFHQDYSNAWIDPLARQVGNDLCNLTISEQTDLTAGFRNVRTPGHEDVGDEEMLSTIHSALDGDAFWSESETEDGFLEIHLDYLGYSHSEVKQAINAFYFNPTSDQEREF